MSPEAGDKRNYKSNQRGRGSGKGRGRGGGRGRGRGRGRAGGGRGRGKGGNKDASPGNEIPTVDAKPSAEQEAVSTEFFAEIQEGDSWFVAMLMNLGHPSFVDVDQALQVEENPKVANEHLVRLTLWLEDRIIRIWKLDEREKLRQNYWGNINRYLEALECPVDYFPNEYYCEEDKELPHWRYSTEHRQKIVFWLLSNATSEAFGDLSSDQQEPFTPNISETQAEAEKAEAKEVEKAAQGNPFPLGFSTGDEEVDHILCLLRMQLLIQIEEDQKAVNAAISQLQSVTSGKAKPLKPAKLRSHNVKPPPPPSRGGRGGRGGRGRRR